MRKFTKTGFPKKWKVLADTKEKDSKLVDYVNSTFKQDLTKGLFTDSKGWWFFNEPVKNPVTEDKQYYLKYEQEYSNDFYDFIELSFDEFEQYVLNKIFFKNTKESHKELKKLLTKLDK